MPAPPALRPAPQRMIERILRQRAAIEGEHKEVTVLFADIQGSMHLAAAVDAEELHAILDRYFAVLAEGVYRYDGCINQFTGDGIMALFGAPLALEDHARHACFAALELRDAVRELGRELRRERGVDFAVRFGLNSGGVVVGSIGDDLRMDYTAQGQVVNLAARMQQIAEAGAIYVAPATAALVADYFELQDLGVFQIKGIDGGVRVRELRQVGALRTRFDVSRARGLTRFVGRAAELAALEAAAAPGGSRLARVVAAAGQGKSRLCQEFLQRRQAAGAAVVAATGLSHARSLAWTQVQQLFRAVLDIDERQRGAQVRERVAGRMLLLGEEYRQHASLVCELLGLAGDEVGTVLEPETRQQRLLEIFTRLLERAAAGRELVLYLDDLHWFDPASQSFVRALALAARPAPVTIVASFRPEYDDAWMQGGGFSLIALAPLSATEMREILSTLLGDSADLAGLIEEICERTAGNPFFAEEAVRALVEAGRLTGAPGCYAAAGEVTVEIPATLHALVAARIDRLADAAKELLQAAAVIGKRFNENILAAAIGADRDALRAALDELIARSFVHVSSRHPVGEYSFEHPLTQEVAERSLLASRRRALHSAVAQAIAADAGDAAEEQAALIAMHWEAAGDNNCAAEWNRRAALWTGWGDVQQTYAHWQRVRQLIPPDSSDSAAVGLRLAALRELLALATRVGVSSAELVEIRAEGNAAARRVGDDVACAAIESSFALARAIEGHVAEAMEIVAVARPLAEAVAPPHAEVGAGAAGLMEFALTAAHVYSWGGGCGDMIAVAELGLGMSAGSDPAIVGTRAWLHVLRGDGLIRAARLAEGEAEIRHAMAEALRPRHAEVRGFAHLGLCRLFTTTGCYDEAGSAADAAIAIGRQSGSTAVLGTAMSLRAGVLVAAGRWRDALELLEPMVDFLDRSGIVLFKIYAEIQLALALIGAGEVGRGLQHARGALEQSRRCGARMYAVLGEIAMARAQALGRDFAAARRHIDRADGEIAALQLESLRPDVYLERAAVARAAGDDDEASAWRVRALRELLAIGAERRAAAIDAADETL